MRKRIFPGAHAPSLRQVMEIFEPSELPVLDVENLRFHYATTLEHWLARFERSADRVQEMFGADFVRAWRLYLAGSLAAFPHGSLQLFQISFAGAECTRIPWTRAYLYHDHGESRGERAEMDSCDVLIVGGGPAGSSCALGLARGGHRTSPSSTARFPTR